MKGIDWRQATRRIGNPGWKRPGTRTESHTRNVSYSVRRRIAGAIVLFVAASMVFALVARTAQHNAAFSTDQASKQNGTLPVMLAATPAAASTGDPYKATGLADSAPGASNSAPATGGGAASEATGSKVAQAWDRKIIRTGTLQLTVKDVSSGVDRVRALAAQHGGYVFQSDSHQEGEYTLSTITIQVPSEEFDKIMPELRKLDGQVKKIVQENVTSSDVTEEYTDLQSQLRNLQATEGRLLALQQKADKLEDILSLDRELRGVQGQIEQIQGRVNFLSKRSEMSSITVSLSPEALAQPITTQAENAWNPGEIAARAWNSSLEMLSGVAGAIITVAVFMWWSVPLLLLAAWLATARPRRRTIISGPAAPAGDA